MRHLVTTTTNTTNTNTTNTTNPTTTINTNSSGRHNASTGATNHSDHLGQVSSQHVKLLGNIDAKLGQMSKDLASARFLLRATHVGVVCTYALWFIKN